MIVDGFTFFNEFELLELRLRELSSVVDRFILVEARETFSFRPKPLYFHEQRERFKPYLSRIDHQVIERFPNRTSPWDAERTQREWIARAFGSEGDPDDLLVFSDLDEIPAASALHAGLAQDGPVSLAQRQYYMFLNCLLVDTPILTKAKVVRRKHLPESIHDLRQLQHPAIPHAGWHFSFLGGASRAQAKMAAFAHQDLNVPSFTSQRNYERALRAGRLHIDAKQRIREVPLDASFPAHVVENRAAYEHLIAPPGLVGNNRWDLGVLRATHFSARVRAALRRRFERARNKLRGAAA